ncbi:MAG: DUF58 domain-containing protein [Rubrivivax sp.]
MAPSRLGASVWSWWLSRLPLTDTWKLGQRNIYILPTRAGFTFALTLVVMLLASINYQLNLGYALTFLLAGAGLVSMHLTHGNLRGLTLHLRPPAAVFTGEAALLEVVLSNPGSQRYGLGLRFEHRGAAVAGAAIDASQSGSGIGSGLGFGITWCDAPTEGQTTAHLSLTASQRGWQPLPALVLETVFPLGLFRAWSVWRPAARLLAWPRPEHPAPALPPADAAAGDSRHARRGANSELDGVRPWRRGDSMRQVAWKKVARSGELVSRETAGQPPRELLLDWSAASPGSFASSVSHDAHDARDARAAPLDDAEQRLSRLTAWVLQAEKSGLAFALRLPARRLPMGLGQAQQRAALDLLAEHR